MIIGGFSYVVSKSIIIVPVTPFLCITGKLYLWEQRFANTSIAIFNSFNLFSSKFMYMLNSSIILTSSWQNPESIIYDNDKLPNDLSSCLKVEIYGS